jgi:hypothetical protein
MPNYEVQWGDKTHFQEAGNPYQACILVMAENVPGNVATSFEVTTFNGFAQNTETVGLDEILNIMVLATDCDLENLSHLSEPEDTGIHDDLRDRDFQSEIC